MAIRKKLYSTTIKMCIALMIDKSNVKRQSAVNALPMDGNAFTNFRECHYQTLVNINIR